MPRVASTETGKPVETAAQPPGAAAFALALCFAVVALAFGIGRLRGAARTFALGGFAAATAFQVAVALAQRAADGPVGLETLGEPGRYVIGGGVGPLRAA